MDALLVREVSFLVPARLDACSIIRDRVNKIAMQCPFTENDLGDIRLSVGEAASNAVRHGCKDRPWAEIAVRCWTDEREFNVEVKDDGPGFDPKSVREPNFFALPEGGMGIFNMRHSMDRVDFSFDGGTSVTLVKQFQVQK